MKLVFAIVQDKDAQKVIRELSKNNYMVTKVSSSGGFLREGNTTLLVGVPDEYVDDVLKIIENKSKSRKQIISTNAGTASLTEIITSMPLEITVGGATCFVVDVEQFRKF